MKKSAVIVGSIILLSAGFALAENKPPRGDKRAHATADKNGDGKVTRDEARAEADARFDRRDTNKDGVLDTKDQRGAPRDGKGARRHHAGMGKKFFEKADANKDGKLSASEADAFGKRRFEKLDADKDGFLTRDELHHKKPKAK